MKKLIKMYQKLTFLQGAAFAVSLTSFIGIAATVTGLNTFTPGTTISSSQMNTNFNILKTAIESGSSQMYVGTYDASLAVDPPGSTTGEYYVITTAGTINAITYAVGDWIIFNGTTWEKITPTSAVSTVFGRTGAIAAAEGDYNLNKLSDVDTLTTPPSNGQVLQFNGSQWIPWTLPAPGETDPTVQSFAKAVLPSCPAGEYLQANGTFFNCASIIPGSPNRAVITDGTGQLVTSSVTSVEMNYLTGVTSPIQTQLDSKLSITGGTLSVGTISGVPAPVNASDVANKDYVDSFGQWTKTGADISFQSGNVGIGTASPMQKLHVVGNAKFDGNMAVAQGSPSTPSISSFNDASTGLFFPAANTIGISVLGTERVRIEPSGNVGIGITSPSYMLTVNGSIGAIGGLQTVSDLRYKKEIKRIPNALDRLLSIDGVSYQFKNAEFPELKFSKRRELGVIAQTVEKVFPEAVSKDKDGFRSVAYSMLISPIIEAIREMNFKTKKLEDENKMLKEYLCERDPNAPFCGAN